MRILFWGTYDLSKPRNRLLIQGLNHYGAEVIEQRVPVWDDVPDKSALSRAQRLLRWFRLVAAYPALLLRFLRTPRPDVVCVGYMGQVDVLVLWPFARLRRVPVAWDAYLSLYNTVVEDRRLCSPGARARLLYLMEWLGVRAADRVFLDTDAHCDDFAQRFGVDRARLRTVRLGVEEDVFFPPEQPTVRRNGPRFRLLFYGQLAPLHGVDVILKAAKRCEGLDTEWLLVGRGQSSDDVRRLLDDLKPTNVRWIPWVPYRELVDLVHEADVCLGIFGNGRKARMVIPNKVLQSLAAGCPVITADTAAIRERTWPPGAVMLVPPGNPDALARKVRTLVEDRGDGASRAADHPGRLELGPAAVGAELWGHLSVLTGHAEARARDPGAAERDAPSVMRRIGAITQRGLHGIRGLARPTIRAARHVYVKGMIGGARLFPRSGPFLIRRITGDDPWASSNRIALYVHYDPLGRVHDYHLDMLRALAAAGFRTTLVSNAVGLTVEASARVAPMVRETLVRRNVGYDFGAWRDGLEHLGDLGCAEQVLLCNDSVYGPFSPLQRLVAEARPDQADVWAMTEGRNHGPHLQSYWMLFHRTAVVHPAFAAFWRTLPYLDDKLAVIEAGELRLSRQLTAAGLRLQALFPYDEAEARFRATADPARAGDRMLLRAIARGRALNPSHHFWRVLIADLGLPFIKRELLALNPAHLDDLGDWQQVVEARFGVLPRVAAEHLATAARPGQPNQPGGLTRLLRTIVSAP